jgi:hypothetical protein
MAAKPESIARSRRARGRKPLRDGLPRFLADHRTSDGQLAGRYIRSLLERLGPLPASARPWLEELGSVMVELREHRRRGQQLTGVHISGPGVEVRRLQRRRMALRSQMLQLERRLEEIAAAVQRPSPASGAELAASMSMNGGLEGKARRAPGARRGGG